MVINDLVPGRSSLPLNLYWVVMNCQTLRKLELEFYWYFIVKFFTVMITGGSIKMLVTSFVGKIMINNDYL